MNYTETPRINGKNLEFFTGKTVFLLCDTSSYSQDHHSGRVMLRTVDGYDITAELPTGEQFESKYVQFFGLLLNSRTIQVFQMLSAGDDLDVQQYNQALELVHGKYKHLFSTQYV